MANITSLPKTDTFKLRINPDIRASLESIYAKSGVSLTDAINVFFQQSLNAGGFPFQVTADNAEILRAKALTKLMKELDVGHNNPVSYTEEEMYEFFGVEK